MARSGKKETPAHSWQQCKIGAATMENVFSFLEKLKTQLPYDLAIPLLDKENVVYSCFLFQKQNLLFFFPQTKFCLSHKEQLG